MQVRSFTSSPNTHRMGSYFMPGTGVRTALTGHRCPPPWSRPSGQGGKEENQEMKKIYDVLVVSMSEKNTAEQGYGVLAPRLRL